MPALHRLGAASLSTYVGFVATLLLRLRFVCLTLRTARFARSRCRWHAGVTYDAYAAGACGARWRNAAVPALPGGDCDILNSARLRAILAPTAPIAATCAFSTGPRKRVATSCVCSVANADAAQRKYRHLSRLWDLSPRANAIACQELPPPLVACHLQTITRRL